MSSTSAVPHQGSNKADALSAELQGHMPESPDVSMQKTVEVNSNSLSYQIVKKRDRRGDDLFLHSTGPVIRLLGFLRGFQHTLDGHSKRRR